MIVVLIGPTGDRQKKNHIAGRCCRTFSEKNSFENPLLRMLLCQNVSKCDKQLPASHTVKELSHRFLPCTVPISIITAERWMILSVLPLEWQPSRAWEVVAWVTLVEVQSSHPRCWDLRTFTCMQYCKWWYYLVGEEVHSYSPLIGKKLAMLTKQWHNRSKFSGTLHSGLWWLTIIKINW